MTQVHGVRIDVDGSHMPVTIPTGRDADTLAALQVSIGGYVEYVRLTSDVAAWVDEDGLQRDLTANVWAVRALRAVTPNVPALVGPVVVTGPIQREKVTELPDAVAERIAATLDAITRRMGERS